VKYYTNVLPFLLHRVPFINTKTTNYKQPQNEKTNP